MRWQAQTTTIARGRRRGPKPGSLGLGCGSAFKAVELREKIEDAMRAGDVLLVLDEGHYLWPQRNMRKAVPHRINWMLTQLVNMGVPVAVISTPQFTRNQQLLAQHGGWSSEQLVGRIMHYENLPDTLAEADLEAVARYWLPEGEEKAIRVLAAYAGASAKYLAGIESLARRALYLAGRAGRATPTFADVKAALQEGVVPSDTALKLALENASRQSGKRATGTARAARLQPAFQRLEEAAQEPAAAYPRVITGSSLSTLEPLPRDIGAAVLST